MWCFCLAGRTGEIQVAMWPRSTMGRAASCDRKEARDAAKPSLRCEESEEDERLMYVALTRARSKMYLPYFPTSR